VGALPAIFHSISCTLLRNWPFFGPRERKDLFADGSLRWFLKLLNKHIEFHERAKDETWQKWCSPGNREPLEQALTLTEETFSAFPQVMPRNDCEAPFRRLTQWMEGHLQSLPPVDPEAEGEKASEEGEGEGEKASEEGSARPPWAAGAIPVASLGSLPVSPALSQLMRKLAAFDTLVERADFRRAGVVAADILSLIDHFDPRVYLPALFSRFFAGLSTCAEQVEPLLQTTETLSFRALDQLYRVDLETFLAQGAQAPGSEE